MTGPDLRGPPVRDDGLQLSEDRPFQGVRWKIQPYAWAGFALILLAALGGMTGGGGYFASQRIDFGGASADLPRVSRWQTSDQISFGLRAPQSGEVVLGKAFARLFSIESITPEPVLSTAADDGLHLRFTLSGSGAKQILIGVRPAKPGFRSFEVSAAGQTRRISVLVLP